MSVFDGDTNQNTETTETKDEKENQSFVEQLVKVKGDKWSDPEVIAKGKIDADTYISELKTQVEELRALAERGGKLEDLVSKIEGKAATPTNATQSKDSGTKEADTKPSERDIESLVEEAITNRERNQTASQNVAVVDAQLKEMFGTEASLKVKEKATELGLSTERLKQIAEESPSAFFNLIGEKPKSLAPQVNGTIRTEAVNTQSGNGVKNNAYYQKLRQSNPRLFNTGAIQNEMLQNRLHLGDKFY